MANISRRPKSYTSLRDWLERTGTKQARLAQMVGIKPPHMSSVLSGSRPCSLTVALKLSRVTGVPVENIARLPKVQGTRTHDAVA